MPLTPAGTKVFIIDDDAAVRVSIADLVHSAGLEAEPFGTPQEFLCRQAADGGRPAQTATEDIRARTVA